MNCFNNIFKGKRILITGHTGFKGSWLALWLKTMGAEVSGYSVDIPSNPSNFNSINLKNHISHNFGDICDFNNLSSVIDKQRPEIIFHLAAQALVQRSYADPKKTFETNSLGTLNLLEILRKRPWIETAIIVTSDKVYKNKEWCWGYRETDDLGGIDPYSSSKSCVELIVSSYINSFFKKSSTKIGIVRAGNVIGGGDWASDRIIPDCINAWSKNKKLIIRNPNSTRPWQHVLEPLSGYLLFASYLLKKNSKLHGEAFNFGPSNTTNQTVKELIKLMSKRWPNSKWDTIKGKELNRYEASLLQLSCDKSLFFLGWRPVLNFQETVNFTIDWYKEWFTKKQNMHDYSLKQINEYIQLAKNKNFNWISK